MWKCDSNDPDPAVSLSSWLRHVAVQKYTITAVANKKVAFKSTSSSSVGTQTSDFTSTKKQPVKREFLYFTDEETPKEKM